MSSVSDRRKKSGVEENFSDNYLTDSYTAMVTMLLVFYVLLFSYSTVEPAKWRSLTDALPGTRPVVITPMSPEIALADPLADIRAVSLLQRKDGGSSGAPERLHRMHAIISSHIDQNGQEAAIFISENERLVRVTFKEQVFFGSADVNVRENAVPVLDSIILMLEKTGHLYSIVVVESHVKNSLADPGQPSGNWLFSTYRAINILDYIRQSGELDMSRITAVGYVDEQPADPNGTTENRDSRIDFVFKVEK